VTFSPRQLALVVCTKVFGFDPRRSNENWESRVFHFLKSSKAVYFFRVGIEKPQIARFSGEVTVLEAALSGGVDLAHSCGGMGSCGTCRVIVLEPSSCEIAPRNEIEQEMAEDRGFRAEERLACQIFACRDLKVQIPD
jgi:2Fe-2S ferredoxin